MEQSPTIGDLAGALAKAQAVMSNVRKTKTAKITMKSGGTYSYTYADLSDVWEMIRKPLTDNGLSIVQSPEMTDQGICLVTTIAHESGEWMTGFLSMRIADQTPQALGTAITYLRRYGLCAMLGIVSDEDGDAPQTEERKGGRSVPQQPPNGAKSPPSRETLLNRIDALSHEADDLNLEIILNKPLIDMSDAELIQHGKNLKAAIDQAKAAAAV